ncbi:MAG: SDR family NAD(P)-dependent oxidoreductase [Armatimonadota bacterium]
MATTVIYGGTGGIGAAVARALRSEGGTVHLVARDADRLASLAGEIGASTTVGDVTDPDLHKRVAADAGESVSGLVYAVGTINLKPLARLGAEDFARDYAVNVTGAALAVQALSAALKRGEQPGSVVLFSSVAAAQGFSFHASTGAAKAAVEGLVRSLAAELAPRIRVNAVAPSLTRTPLAAALTAREEAAAAIAALHALPRLGEADDIAAAVRYLLSDQASWTTGHVLAVDGGRSTLRPKG